MNDLVDFCGSDFVWLFIEFFDLGCYRKKPQKNKDQKVDTQGFQKHRGTLSNSSGASRTSSAAMATCFQNVDDFDPDSITQLFPTSDPDSAVNSKS